MQRTPERRLAAIMFTDVVGYTALMAESEEAGRQARERHARLVRARVEAYGGRLIEDPGDESLSSFPSALDAVNCALAIQAELAGDPALRVRIGVHSGDVVFDADRVWGDGVNVASRIRPLAEPGGICVSEEVVHSIRNQPGIATRALGPQELRNVGRPIAVFAVHGTAQPPSARRRAPATAAGRRARAPRLAAAGVAIALLAAAAWWWLPRPSATPGAIRSLAVLPLANLTGDPAQEFFSDGMTEALTAALAKLRSLRVISRTSAMRYKRADRSLPEIARELDVDAVIEGSVARDGDRVRVTAQLVHAASDAHLWAESYERDGRDVLGLQAELARAIAAAVKLELTPQEARQLQPVRPVDPAAYEAFLRGRHHWSRRTGAELRRALAYFEEAAALDPEFAPALAGLADAQALLASWFGDPPREAMPRARAAAERALAIDEDLAEAHVSLGSVRHWYDWDWAGAEREYRRASELDPSLADAHFRYSEVLRTATRFEESEAQLERALRLDPVSPIVNAVLGIQYVLTRQDERAIGQFERTLEIEPGFMFALRELGLLRVRRGELDEALPLLRRGVELHPGDLAAVSSLAEGLALAGRRDEAIGLLPRLIAPDGRPVPEWIARVQAALGERDAAFEWLERAYEERSRQLTSLRVDASWDPLRGDPRFADLVRRVEIPQPNAG